MLSSPGFGADWPTWRHDSHRTAASPEGLADQLQLQWTRELPAYQQAWPNEPRLNFDASYEPIVMGGGLFLGSPLDGSVRAFSTQTGDEQWRFYTGGPMRFAPVGWQGRVLAGSDDGYLYCLSAESGALLWRVRGAPDGREDRWHLGNARLISFWPVRGGPVIEDGVVYFAAGIWPSLGVFVRMPGWDDALYPYTKNREIYRCPDDERNDDLSYGMNFDVAGTALGAWPSLEETVAFYDAELLLVVERHNDGANYAYLDGHAKWLGDPPEDSGLFARKEERR